MTYAGFFVHLNSIPPVLRWLQWLCPLKYTLEALSVNEVGSGLKIQDTLDGVPIDVSASLIMETVSNLCKLLDALELIHFVTAVRFWREELLSRCVGLVRVHCRVRLDGYWCCLDQIPRKTLIDCILRTSVVALYTPISIIVSLTHLHDLESEQDATLLR